uniref:WW domain-containing protein n=1 Tax=viral metagenome TaxID=1070528 RepID=A0A6C0KZT5_9ZZZZ
MHPIQLCSAYVFDSELGHDVTNLIRQFIMNPFTEIKLKGTISRVKMLANFHKQQLGLGWWETEGTSWSHLHNIMWKYNIADRDYMIKQLNKCTCSYCSKHKEPHDIDRIECFSWEKASGIRFAENGDMYDSLNDDRKLPNTYSNLKKCFSWAKATKKLSCPCRYFSSSLARSIEDLKEGEPNSERPPIYYTNPDFRNTYDSTGYKISYWDMVGDPITGQWNNGFQKDQYDNEELYFYLSKVEMDRKFSRKYGREREWYDNNGWIGCNDDRGIPQGVVPLGEEFAIIDLEPSPWESYRDADYIHSIGKGKYYYNKKNGETTFKRPEGFRIEEDNCWHFKWRPICKSYDKSEESESDEESEYSEESERNDESMAFDNYYSILRS